MAEDKVPSPADFILRHPLYLETEWVDKQILGILELRYFQGVVDSYCVECQNAATFRGKSVNLPSGLKRDVLGGIRYLISEPPTFEDGPFSIELVCTRNDKHTQQFIFRVLTKFSNVEGKFISQRSIQKIGQYPSIADLHIPQLRKYKSILGEEKHRELVRGVGLASHGVGIGAFVYIRRVFESLLEDAHEIAKADPGWDEDVFQRQRVIDRIEMLSHHLPATLVKNRSIYSILSKGIHELSEDDCLRYFEPMRMGIELVLDEKLEAASRQSKTERLQKFIDKARSEIKENSGT